jgi:tRNA(Ile)-lysidine synthase
VLELINSGDRVIAAVSGGADSTAMLHMLTAMDVKITAAHVNHQLRGADSDEDERFVAEMCKRLNIPLRVRHADVAGLALKEGLTIEEAGRQCRYAFFEALLIEVGANKIAVAHNMDDNAETVLLNLSRGSGLLGLCGIPPVRGSVVRPLINTPRSEIEKYLLDNKIPFRTDATNLTGEYTRGRVRSVILPALKEHVNGNALRNIARNSVILRGEEDYLAEAAGLAFTKCRAGKVSAGNGVALDADCLLNEHPAIIRRVIRLAYAETNGGAKDLSARHVEQAADILRGGTGRETGLPGPIAVRKEYNKLIFQNENAGAEVMCKLLEWDRPVCLPSAGITVTASVTPWQNFTCTKLFRYDTLKNVLALRTRRPGDRITLPGGTRKLQDYFTDKKVPRAQRDKTPLVADGSEILWILDEAGRVNERYKPSAGEKCFYISIGGASNEGNCGATDIGRGYPDAGWRACGGDSEGL